MWISWFCWILLILLNIFQLRKAAILSLPQLPFSLPGCPVRDRQHAESDATHDNRDNEARAALAEIEQPRVAVKYNLRSQGASGGGGGSRTPPPVRPVPPRPGVTGGQPVTMTKY